mgnify:FL=1
MKKMNGKRKIKVSQIVLNIILILMCAMTLYPLLLCLGVSFSEEQDVLKYGYAMIPRHFSLAAYKYVFANPKSIIDAYTVTIIFSVAGTLGMLIFNSMMAYPLSRQKYRFRNGLNFYFYFTCLFGGGLVPTYLLYTRYLHLSDTIWVYIIPGLVSAWNIFYIRASFQALPEEIIESAVLDGASEWRILVTFMIPLSKPVLATLALQTFLGKWNDWYTSMLYINDKMNLISLQYLLQRIMLNAKLLQDNNTSGLIDVSLIPGETANMAMMFVVTGPALIVFPFFQKYFVKGMVIGSVKG